MSKQQIVLADSHVENVRILKENFEHAGFQVYIAVDCDEAVEKIKTVHPDLLLSEYIFPDADGAQLIARLAEDPKSVRTPIVFLSKKGDIETRLRGLKLGAKDYLVKPMHVKEVLARVNLVLSRLDRLETEVTESEAILSGKLDEVRVLDLIEHVTREKRTGILKLRNGQNRDGQIFVKNGIIINAMTRSLLREDAVFEMMLWKHGKFSILFQQIDTQTEIYVSTLGLLLEGARRISEWENLVGQLPGLDSVLTVTTNFRKILNKREITPELRKFIGLFDGKSPISEILQQSEYNTLSSLERIVKLYRQGFIQMPDEELETESAAYVITADELPEEEIIEKSIEYIPPPVPTKNVQEKPKEKPLACELPTKQATTSKRVLKKGVLFIGSAQGGRKTIINTITEGEFRVKVLRGLQGISLDRGSTLLENGTILEVFGLEPDLGLSTLSNILTNELSGYVVLLDGINKELYEYYTYLILSIQEYLTLPHIIVILNYNAKNVEVLRKKLHLDSNEHLVSCDPHDRASLIEIVSALVSEQHKEKFLNYKDIS